MRTMAEQVTTRRSTEIASPSPLTSAWTRSSIDTGRSRPSLLLQRGRQHLGDVDHLAVADLADDHRVEELPVDAVRVLAAEDQPAPHGVEGLLGQRGQDL